MVKKKVHAQANIVVFSRSAAKLKQARMSCSVRYGKSSKTSCVVIPAARYDKTS